jgi:hypothetical protein
MKILFLFHPYVNEGMTRAFCAVSEPVFCSTGNKPSLPREVRRMCWSEFFSLRRRIRAREFDLILAYACEEGLWRPNRSFFHNLIHAVKKLLFYFPAFGVRLLLPTIKASGTRLIIYDYDDPAALPRCLPSLFQGPPRHQSPQIVPFSDPARWQSVERSPQSTLQRVGQKNPAHLLWHRL